MGSAVCRPGKHVLWASGYSGRSGSITARRLKMRPICGSQPNVAMQSEPTSYPHRIEDGTNAAGCGDVLQQVLEEQPDQSVTIAQVGFSTNLARLVESPGGQRTDCTESQAACSDGWCVRNRKIEPEYNVYTDPEAAEYLFANWPTPMVFSGFEIGLQVKFTYESY